VLWLPEAIKGFSKTAQTLIELNPLYSMLGGYAEVMQDGRVPPPYVWVGAAAWALGVAVVGFLFFISREREFAVRLT
jgi:teichoic acid transport system permease protein